MFKGWRCNFTFRVEAITLARQVDWFSEEIRLCLTYVLHDVLRSVSSMMVDSVEDFRKILRPLSSAQMDRLEDRFQTAGGLVSTA